MKFFYVFLLFFFTTSLYSAEQTVTYSTPRAMLHNFSAASSQSACEALTSPTNEFLMSQSAFYSVSGTVNAQCTSQGGTVVPNTIEGTITGVSHIYISGRCYADVQADYNIQCDMPCPQGQTESDEGECCTNTTNYHNESEGRCDIPTCFNLINYPQNYPTTLNTCISAKGDNSPVVLNENGEAEIHETLEDGTQIDTIYHTDGTYDVITTNPDGSISDIVYDSNGDILVSKSSLSDGTVTEFICNRPEGCETVCVFPLQDYGNGYCQDYCTIERINMQYYENINDCDCIPNYVYNPDLGCVPQVAEDACRIELKNALEQCESKNLAFACASTDGETVISKNVCHPCTTKQLMTPNGFCEDISDWCSFTLTDLENSCNGNVINFKCDSSTEHYEYDCDERLYTKDINGNEYKTSINSIAKGGTGISSTADNTINVGGETENQSTYVDTVGNFDTVVKTGEISNTTINKTFTNESGDTQQYQDLKPLFDRQRNQLDLVNTQLSELNRNLSNAGGGTGGEQTVNIDLTETNARLQGIQESIDAPVPDISTVEHDLSQSIDDAQGFVDEVKQQYEDFATNIQDTFDSIDTQFNDTKAILEGDFSFALPQPTSEPCFTTTLWGNEISLNPCPFLQIVAPLFNFMLTIFFMILTVKITMSYIFKGGD